MPWADRTFRKKTSATARARWTRTAGISTLTPLVVAALVAASSPAPPAPAQKPSPPPIPAPQKEAEKASVAPADDPLGRSTPFGTVLGFVKAAEREEMYRALDYLDTQQPPRRARLLAQELAAVLNGADLLDLRRNPDGDLEDGLPPGRERVGVVKTDSESHEIFLERTERGSGTPIWLFSADTLKRVPRIHRELGVSWIERHFSGTFLDARVLGHPLWRWIGIVLALPIAFAIARVAGRLLPPALHGLVRRVAKRPVDYPAARLKWPIHLVVVAGVFYVISLIALSAASRLFWGYVAATMATIAFTWIGLRLIDDAPGLFGAGPQALLPLGSGRIATERLLSRLAKILVIALGVAILFYIAGVDATAVLTGLGIGGIAVALAAQKSLENIFGAMTILSDKSIRVGDFCRAGEFTGVVEDIGLRSTRIRTVGRTLVSVPNGQLVAMSLENFSLRDKILFHHRIHLGHGTSAGQLHSVLARIRTLLAAHPKAEAQTARVSLTGFRDFSIELAVFAYILETSYEAFLPVQEELLLRIMDAVEGSGARFASPPPGPYAAADRRVHP